MTLYPVTILLYCSNCKRTTWFWRQPKQKYICRGDISRQLAASENTDMDNPPHNLDCGCGHEYGIKK